MIESKVWLIVTSDTIWHEGDQRSRDYPWHGYPAYSETVDRIERFTNYKEFVDKVEYLMLNKTKYFAYEAIPMVAKFNTTVSFA